MVDSPPPMFSCSHMSPGSFWLKPKSGCFLFLSKVAVFCFFISQFLCPVYLVPAVQWLSLPRYAYLLSQTGGEWFVIGARSGYVLRGGAHPSHVKSGCWLLVLLFHLVSICLCILLGPRVGGWVGGVWEGYGCEMPREDPAILTEEHQLLIVDTNFLFPSWRSTVFIEHKACRAFFQRSFGFYTPQSLSPVSCFGKTPFFGLLCAGMTWSVWPAAVFSPTLALSPRSMPGWCQDRKIFQIIARLKKPSQSRRTL